MLGNIVYQLRVANGGRVNGNLVGTGIEQAVYVTQFVDPSPDSKRNTDIGSYSPNKLGKSFATFVAGRNVEKNQLICPLLAISTSQLHRITGLAQVYEIRPLYGLTVFDIKTRYDSFC